MKKAFIFPGQGSQFVGMGKDLYAAFPAAREVFEEVDDALNEKLSTLIFEGPLETLTLTQNTQPALMTVSLAVIRVLEKEGGFDLSKHIHYLAGHSLGEYSALAAGRALSLADTARLLRIRGNAMQDAVPVGAGSMAALLGIDVAGAEAIASEAAQGDICAVANDNAPGQVVLSGSLAAIERAILLAGQAGKRSVKLAVSAPFHSLLMRPAELAMEEALAEVRVNAPVVPLIANVTAEEVSDPASIRELLVKQVTGVVRWRETILNLKAKGVEAITEIGAGKVLTGLTKRIDKDIASLSLQTPEDIEAFLRA